jgi:hypothetical protein
MLITEFKLSPWLIIDFDFVLGLLHRVEAGDFDDSSEVHPEDGINMHHRNVDNIAHIRYNNLRTESIP